MLAVEKWILYALASMVFAGVVAVIAKLGLTGISAELGLAIRTCFVLAFVLAIAAAVVPRRTAGTHAAELRLACGVGVGDGHFVALLLQGN